MEPGVKKIKIVNVIANSEMYKAVSPVYNVPRAFERVLPPHLCLVGSQDVLISTASIKEYISLLESKGQVSEYWEHKGRNHAFLDSKKNDFLGTEFRKDAPAAIDRMIELIN